MSEIKNFDETFCGKLPLHLTNMIQPHGGLIIVSKQTVSIIQVSENIQQFTGFDPMELINKPLAGVIPPEDLHVVMESVQSSTANRSPVNFTLIGPSKVQLLGLIHSKQDHFIIEVEKREDEKTSGFLEFYKQVRYLMAAIESGTSKEEICAVALKELSKLSGFDRIMIYEFDESWNGTVIAEQMNVERLDSYLELKFPASDVPKPARDLYYRNPYRLIPDRNYTPSRLYPVLNPIAGGFTDLSDCNLRSVASVHLEYLANMGVTASMSTRIIRDDKLWGLISCHHSTPKYLDFEMCSIFELVSNIFSARLNSLANKETYQKKSAKQDVLVTLLRQVEVSGIVDGLLNQPVSALELLDVTGAAVIHKNKIYAAGVIPDTAAISNLALWLQTSDSNRVFHTSRLSDKHDAWIDFSSDGSGIIAIPYGIGGGNDYIIGFRPETVRTVQWGGNPNEALTIEADQNAYHPRNSFNIWKQQVKHTSSPWEPYIVDVAENLRSLLIEFTAKNN